MNTTKPKIKRTSRRKTTETSPLDESINKYVDEVLSNDQGHGSPQELFSAAVRNFSKRLLEAMLQGEMDAHLKGVRATEDAESIAPIQTAESGNNKLKALKKKCRQTAW